MDSPLKVLYMNRALWYNALLESLWRKVFL